MPSYKIFQEFFGYIIFWTFSVVSSKFLLPKSSWFWLLITWHGCCLYTFIESIVCFLNHVFNSSDLHYENHQPKIAKIGRPEVVFEIFDHYNTKRQFLCFCLVLTNDTFDSKFIFDTKLWNFESCSFVGP